MDSYPEVKIVTHGITSEVFINGKKIDGISKWSVSHEAGKLPQLRLDIINFYLIIATSNRTFINKRLNNFHTPKLLS